MLEDRKLKAKVQNGQRFVILLKEWSFVKKLIINNDNIIYKEVFIRCCPFSALEIREGAVVANENCRLCGSCVKKAKQNECYMVETEDED